MAAVSLPSGPVTALHPETEMVEVESGSAVGLGGDWGKRGVKEREYEVTVRIIVVNEY